MSLAGREQRVQKQRQLPAAPLLQNVTDGIVTEFKFFFTLGRVTDELLEQNLDCLD